MVFREGDNSEDTKPDRDEAPTGEEDTKVRLDDAEDDSDDADEGEEEPKAAKGDGDQPRKPDGKWAEKKAQRGKERKAARAWETEKADYDRRLSQMREESDRTARQLREEIDRIRQGGAGKQQDPISTRLLDVKKQISDELSLLQKDDSRDYTRYNELRDAEAQLIAERVFQTQMERQAQVQRSQPADPYASRRVIIESEYPWVVDDRYRELAQAARAYKEYLVKVEKRPDTIETDREALAHIQAKSGGEYGLRAPAQPSQRTRSFYAGPASRGMPDRRPAPREYDLGAAGQGHGLSPDALKRAVRAAIGDDN